MRSTRLAVVLWAVLTGTALGAPQHMPAQGRLTKSSGQPAPAGTYTFTFRIMSDSTAGVAVWPLGPGEAQTLHVEEGGIWQAQIGAINPIPSSVFEISALWLEITVNDGTTSETLSRIRLGSGPWAFQSTYAGLAGSSSFATQAGSASTLEGHPAADFASDDHTHSPADISPQGAGSGLDADLLDGQTSADFAQSVHSHTPDAISPQGAGSGLDADLLDGKTSVDFAQAVHSHTPLAISPQGPGSQLNADFLDNHDASFFADSGHTHRGLWSENGPNIYFDSGRVGIGTTSPENMLHVRYGTSNGVIPNSASVGILESNNIAYLSLITPDFAERGILFAEPSNSMAGGIIYNNASTPDGIQFRTAYNVKGMALESNGRLSIGTFTGSGALQVSGPGSNATVVLPSNSIGPDEILGEPGLASNFNGATVTLASTTMQDIVTVDIDVPASGYVFLTGKCNGTTYNTTGRNQGTVQIVETTTGAPVSPYLATFGLVGYTSTTLANSFPVYVERVFFKNAGTYTFRLEAAQNSGNTAPGVTRVGQAMLTAVFYPTSYGDVMTTASSSEASQFGTSRTLSQEEGGGVAVDLRQLELEATRLRLKAQEAELELERARAAQAATSEQR